MATAGKSTTTNNNKKRKQYLAHNKPVKKKGWYPLHPGVQGFFITCDGGRERQASHEAVEVIESFYEELVSGVTPSVKVSVLVDKPMNKKIVFEDSDSSGSDSDENKEKGKEDVVEKKSEIEANKSVEAKAVNGGNGDDDVQVKVVDIDEKKVANDAPNVGDVDEANGLEQSKDESEEAEEPQAKKLCVEAAVPAKVEQSVDRLIEAELEEFGDRNKRVAVRPYSKRSTIEDTHRVKKRVNPEIEKCVSEFDGKIKKIHHLARRFANLDTGCNGMAFVQMRKRDGDPSPKQIVQHMMTSLASTKKHVSRFILRLLPVEVSCYPSEDEISKAIKPMIEQYFPLETETPFKFAVIYEARANSGVERMKIINCVAKAVPPPHKVDLSNPDFTILVQIIKTVCLIGIAEKYKELSKYNVRQLTSSET